MNSFYVLRSFLVSLTITAYIVIAIESPSRLSTCHPGQRDALSRFNRSFSISGTARNDICMGTSYPKTASWREDEDCCSWEGVTCDNSTGAIVGLDLSCARLLGKIDPSSSLFSLCHLRSLSLTGNNLIGSSIPPEISVFSRMTYLNLSWSNISGIIPAEISQLSKLVSLDLSGNGLDVQNPTMSMLVKNLTQLEELHLSYVNMSAVILTSLMNFSSSLISLHLSLCRLVGKVPDYIFQLPNLQQLDLSVNSGLHGTLPESNWSSNLAFLSLAGCSFAGEVPNSIGTLIRLTSLDLSECSFGGRFPENIFQFPNLQLLNLYLNSGLYGTLPESKWSNSLVFISLGDCSFNGEVPHSIGSLPRLTSLDLSGNNFTGDVDFRTFSTLKNLRFLWLSGLSVLGEDATDANHTFPKLEILDISFGTLIKFPCFLSSMPELRVLSLSQSIVSEFPGQCANNGLSFPQLQTLDMYSCNLTKFPSFLSQSNKLRYISLTGNKIEEIPSWFWGIGIDTLEELDLQDNIIRGRLRLPWKRLDILNLQNNSFEGPLPIPTSRSISEFRLSQNRFNGSIPLSICQLTSLVSLSLSQNNLMGVVPPGLGNLTDLQYLDLSSNSLTGPLPLPSYAMHYYLVSNNNFSGEISSLLCNATNLWVLDLSNNGLTGTLPQCLKNITAARSVSVFRLSQNRFNGSIPVSICQLTHLQHLALSQNNLMGVIPRCLINRTDLRHLDLSSNSLTGPLPLPSYAMHYYSVSNNNFSGKISSLICNATNLQLLDMSNNGLTGTLPQCLKNVTVQLNFLNLRANGFQGSIPEIFHEQSSLTSLDFSRNQFDGALPRSLSNCQSLEALDVGSNKIVDSFPDWLGDLPLKVLNLRSNKFHGRVSISEGTRPFSSIRILDISNNGFDGSLPDNLITETFGLTRGDGGNAIGYMTPNGSSEYYSVMIILKGVEIEMVKINVQFAALDLSSNRFYGEIPRNIGLLKSLKGLNFSHNCFTGTIPPSVANLTDLESLDLSSNYLVGGIPRELAKLTSLGALDLSRNNLTGPIPLGGHFNTFPNSSFDGNPGLCGIPLTRACSQGHAESQLPHNQGDNGEDEPGRWLEWKFVAMGFGSGLGIGISLGYMALEIGRPLWLARIIIRLESSRRKGSKRKSPRRNGRR